MNNKFRVGMVLFIVLLGIAVPVVWSGYSELQKAPDAPSHLEAAEHYLSAAQRLPWRRDVYESAGFSYYLAQEYSLADDAYQKAFEYNELSSNGWLEWGDVNFLRGDRTRAAEIWKLGLSQQDPPDYLYLRLANIYENDGDYSQAVDHLQRYIPNHLEDASAHYQLGLLLTLSDPNEALSHLMNASQLDPKFGPAVQSLRTALNLASIDDSPSQRLVITGNGLGVVNEWELARAAFEQAVQMDGDNAEAWAWLAEANQQTGEGEALTHLDRALELDSNSSAVRGLRGLYFQRIGNNREALVEFQAAAQLEPDNPAWYVSVGESYSKLGDLIHALEAYQYATTLAPKDVNYYLLLAGFCAQNNVNMDVGVAAAQQAVQLTPKDPRALDVLGWTYLLAGRYDEAERMLFLALEHDPQFASAHFHLALLYLQREDYKAMYEHLVKARDIGNSEAQALLDQYFP